MEARAPSFRRDVKGFGSSDSGSKSRREMQTIALGKNKREQNASKKRCSALTVEVSASEAAAPAISMPEDFGVHNLESYLAGRWAVYLLLSSPSRRN